MSCGGEIDRARGIDGAPPSTSPYKHASSRRHRGEEGFTLAALMVILTILAIVVAYTVPDMWSDVLRRERDRETIWTMKQYARAIMEFSRKNGGQMPTTLEQLQKQNTPRVLRRLYPDPLTGKLDWILIPPGQGGSTIPIPGQPNPPPTGTNNEGQPEKPRPSTPPMPGQPDDTQTGGPGGAKDYVGPFVGVRPPISGKSFIALNGIDRYEQWRYTVDDLKKELNPVNQMPGVPPQQQPQQ